MERHWTVLNKKASCRSSYFLTLYIVAFCLFILYFGLQNHCRWWPQPWNKKMLASWKKSYDQPKQHINKQKHYFTNKGPPSQSYGFSSSHVWMWELDYKESWAPKNWCFWTVVLEKTLESPLDCKEIQPVHPKGNQSWIFFGRTDVEAETPVLWATWCEEPTHLKRLWCWERLKAGGEGSNRGWDGWMAQWTWLWIGSGSWWWTGRPGSVHGGHKELDTTEQLNWTVTESRPAFSLNSASGECILPSCVLASSSY